MFQRLNSRTRFSHKFFLARDKEATVAESFSNDGYNDFWEVELVKNLNDWEINEYINLFHSYPSKKGQRKPMVSHSGNSVRRGLFD